MNYTEFLQKEKAYMEAYEEIRETAVSICKHFTELNPEKYPLIMGSDTVNVITTSSDVKITVKTCLMKESGSILFRHLCFLLKA